MGMVSEEGLVRTSVLNTVVQQGAPGKCFSVDAYESNLWTECPKYIATVVLRGKMPRRKWSHLHANAIPKHCSPIKFFFKKKSSYCHLKCPSPVISSNVMGVTQKSLSE